MVYVITAACIDVTDRSCVDECPVDCVYEGRRKLYIHPEECIDCGACARVCPVDAIVWERDLDGDGHAHLGDAHAFFYRPLSGRPKPIGAPGGAGMLGPVGVDTDLVTAARPAVGDPATNRSTDPAAPAPEAQAQAVPPLA
ncbi:ferredoxin [Frankia sp. AvcI1]|uniref:ferredoxin n=1 Tax=Frankia sp. AvcI1 TaxID=573496 RepID=UPI0006EBE2B1|nr:ferredoxin [Frankia sp. AvcI1]